MNIVGQAMKRDEDSLPSILYARFKNNPKDELLDYDSLLLNVLTTLSTFKDIIPYFGSYVPSNNGDIGTDQDFDIVAWISGGLTQKPETKSGEVGQGIKPDENVSCYEWSMGLRYIHGLLIHIKPFELHCLASQSIFLSYGREIPHRILCLILCSFSLRQCPLSLQKRWKRWQSLVCETLRIFQDSIHILDGNDYNVGSKLTSFSLFIYHIVPSSLHVINQLPLSYSYHVAIFSGLMGTCSNLIGTTVGRCEQQLSGDKNDATSISSRFSNLLSSAYETMQMIISSFNRFGFCEKKLWIETIRRPNNIELNRNENVEFWMHRDDLSWWVNHRCNYVREERIARMDTSFHRMGLGLLAMKAFQERPIVYQPTYVWTIWFPHVVELFSKFQGFISLSQKLPYRFLSSLLEIIPEESLLQECSIMDKSELHLELFHLLSNQLMSQVQKTNHIEEGKIHEETNNVSLNEETQFRLHSQHTVRLIKALLTRFTTASQVKIVEQMIQNCSVPGFQARFLDLLRPLILVNDFETEKLLWTLLMSILDEMFKKHWNREEQVLVDVDTLINRDVEISVGAITMIQMWSQEHDKATLNGEKTIAESLRGFHMVLQKLLTRWSEDASTAPKLHYRLFLLDCALENTCNSFKNAIT